MEGAPASARALRARYRQVEGGGQRLRLLEAAAAAFAAESTPRAALEVTLREAARFLGADGGVVLALEGGGLSVLARHGEALPPGARLPLGGVLSTVLRSPLHISLREHVQSRLRLGRSSIVALELVLPMALRGKAHGLLGLTRGVRAVMPDEEDLQALRALATLASLGLPGPSPGIGRARPQRRDLGVMQTQLTPREQQVLALLPRGLTNAEIAEQLGIAAGTAKIHVERILHKLGVGDRTQAAVRASEWGLKA
jgi:DNA-binding CsgD family transcriptional regulator